MKFCIKCGAKLNDDDLFCYRCGTKCPDQSAEENKVDVEEKVEPIISPKDETNINEDIKEQENNADELFVDDPFEVVEKKEEPKEETAPQGKLTFRSGEPNKPEMIKNALLFLSVLVGISIIYWFIGAFVDIHVAIKVLIFLLSLGAPVIPSLDVVKLVMYSIRNKKIDMFLFIVLGICQIFFWTFISINMGAISS